MDADWRTVLDGIYDGRPVRLLKYEDSGEVWFKVETVQKGDLVGEAYRDGDSFVEGVTVLDGEPIVFEASSQDLYQQLLDIGFSPGAGQDIARHAQ